MRKRILLIIKTFLVLFSQIKNARKGIILFEKQKF